MTQLVELDSLEILVIVDNELDPLSPCMNEAVQQSGGLKDIGMSSAANLEGRGEASQELRMDKICCGAHGLSLMITGRKGDQSRTMLFDTGPEEHVWERNATRLGAHIDTISMIQLSHWHRDHSGGMLKAIDMINAAARQSHNVMSKVVVDLHPDRPDYRGAMAMKPVSLEADPTFEDIGQGGDVQKNDQAHTVLDGMFMVSGEIPRVTSYEKGLKRGIRFVEEKAAWEEDTLIRDERFLMCKLKDKGIVMFTGCSHAGVVNASKHAVELGGDTPLYAVMGGFHLADAEAEHIADTVKDLQDLKPKVLLTGHCTGWRAKFEIEKKMPGSLVPSFVGSRFVL